MSGYGSAGKFYFLSLLVKQLGPCIWFVFRGNHKVHSANKAMKQLWIAFLPYLSVFLAAFPMSDWKISEGVDRLKWVEKWVAAWKMLKNHWFWAYIKGLRLWIKFQV